MSKKISKYPSIKQKLITALSLSLSTALIITYIASFISTKWEVNEVFDGHLIKSSKLIYGLIHYEIAEKRDLKFLRDPDSVLQKEVLNRHENKIHFQAWYKNKLIYSSDEKMILAQPKGDGFRDYVVSNIEWRSFSLRDKKADIQVLVLEKYLPRNQLILEIVLSLFLPLFIAIIPLFLIIVTTVNRRINPLHRLTIKMKKMSTTTLENFHDNHVPLELRPITESFNLLINRLRNALESERRFTDYAAHELRTPLAAIKIQAQLIAKNQNKAKEKEYIQDLLDGVDRASYMVSQLLTLARIESETKAQKDAIKNNNENVELPAIINSLIEIFADKISNKNLTINFISEPIKKQLVGNSTHFEILLRNIIDNAIKYSSNDSNLEIKLSNNDGIKIEVSNYGEPISKIDQERIFSNFYRVNYKNVAGSGLGLAIVKKIADLYKGRVEFTSNSGLNSIIISLPLT